MATKSFIALLELQNFCHHRPFGCWGLVRSVTSFEAINFLQEITQIGVARRCLLLRYEAALDVLRIHVRAPLVARLIRNYKK